MDDPDTANLQLSPDWVCEVLSPATQKLDRAKKLAVYRREAVGHVWLVDPAARTLEVLRLSGELYTIATVFADDEVVRAEPFDAITIDLSALWQR